MNTRVFSFPTALVAIPLLCYALLATMAWFSVGHWPTYNNPDPHSLRFYHIGTVAALVGLISVILSPIASLVYVTLRSSYEWNRFVHVPTVVCIYVAGALPWLVDFVQWRAGTGGLVNWIFD